MKAQVGGTFMITMTKQQQEAIEFAKAFQYEQQQSEQWLEQKIAKIEAGNLELSTEELQFGARLAWRNSNKCIGRLFWHTLQVFDRRQLIDEKDIFDALLEHIRYATNEGKLRPAISVFAPGRVRIWNHQLIRYAGYETEQGIVGDPHSVTFTKQLQQRGWKGSGGRFDVLPIMIQIDNREPMWFEIPPEDVLQVPIEHPDNEAFQKLALQWYAVPVISDMRFDCGGVTFEAAPFNGWYMGTEIGARNLADVKRYNELPNVAQILGIKQEGNSSLWKDRALVELNVAVLHSFKKHGVSIVDHHTAAQQFKLFQQKEQQEQRDVTGNWTWLVPPLSPATTHIYHSPISNIIKKPNYFYQKAPY